MAWAADSAAGHYVLVGARETGSELVLKPDGNFEFMLAYGALDLLAEGTWRQEVGAVILNTRLNVEPVFRQTRSAALMDQGLRITAKGAEGRGVEHIEVILDAAHEKTGPDGAAIFDGMRSAKTVSFHVPVYDVDAGPFPLDPARNDFEFLINGQRITQVPFQNERLKIQGRTLEMRFFDQDKAMVYRRS